MTSQQDRAQQDRAQHERAATLATKPATYPWPRDIAELIGSFWGDLDWPRRAFNASDGVLRIEEAVEGDTMIVRAEIPGVDPDKDVEISVDDGVLTIKARRESKSTQTKDDTIRSEFRYGSFVRQVRMPKAADLDALTASYNDGVIEIKVPMRVEHAPSSRRVPISRV